MSICVSIAAAVLLGHARAGVDAHVRELDDSWGRTFISYSGRTRDSAYFNAKYSDMKKRFALDTIQISALCRRYSVLGVELRNRGHNTLSILYFEKLLADLENSLEEENDWHVKARLHFLIASCYGNLSMFERAHIELLKAEDILKKHPSKEELIGTYNHHAELCYMQKDYKGAKRYLEDALMLAKGDRTWELNIYNNLGIIYSDMHDTIASTEAFRKSTELSDSTSSTAMFINVGRSYFHVGEYETALKWVNEGLERIPAFEDHISGQLLKATLLQKTGDYAAARVIRHRLEPTISNSMPNQRVVLLKEMADLCFEMNDSVAGLQYMRSYIAESDSLDLVRHNVQMDQFMVELENRNETVREQEKTIHLRTTAIIVICSGIVTALLIWALVRINGRFKKAHARQSEISGKLDHRNRELTTASIDLETTGRMYSDLAGRLEKITENPVLASDEIKREMKSVISELKQYATHRLDGDFLKYYNEVNPELLLLLKRQHPNLTDKDVRLCCFLHMGLSSKEIANLTYRDVSAVDKSRQRLRKKLGLENGASLQQYLQTLSTSPAVNN